MLQRDFVKKLHERLRGEAPLIQVVLGPRQVGKTTGVKQLLKAHRARAHYASADDVLTASREWLLDQWRQAREKGPGSLLIVDEIQKIGNWSEIIKGLWDRTEKLKVVLLGSSALHLHKGLTESLAGRFELIEVPHWGFLESRRAFGYDLTTFLRFGGYPGADPFRLDPARWFAYLKSSVVDTVIGQDILTQQTVTKPALFRQAFEILCGYPAQEISYLKVLGQLQDKGNIDLVKHYMELYESAYFFRALFKYSPRPIQVKSSSPKIIPLCPAFYSLAMGPDIIDDPIHKGRAFEAAVGADLLKIMGGRLYYWRDREMEVDYVLVQGGRLYAVEVKSRPPQVLKGLESFRKAFPAARACVIHFDNYANFCNDPLAFLKNNAL